MTISMFYNGLIGLNFFIIKDRVDIGSIIMITIDNKPDMYYYIISSSRARCGRVRSEKYYNLTYFSHQEKHWRKKKTMGGSYKPQNRWPVEQKIRMEAEEALATRSLDERTI